MVQNLMNLFLRSSLKQSVSVQRRIILFFFLVLQFSLQGNSQVELVVKNGEAPCNSSFSSEIYVNNFNAINSLQFTIEFDEDHLDYAGFQNLIPSGTVNLNTSLVAQGILQFTWTAVAPVNLGNGAVILLLEFDHIGSCEEPFIVHIIDNPTPIMATGPSGQQDVLVFGAVFLIEDDCDVEVEAGEDQFVCKVGDNVTLNGQISGDFYDFFWKPENLVSNPLSLNTTASVPDNPTVFTLTGRAVTHNIVYNTHFDFGYAGFFSDYDYDEDDISAGNAFAIANSPDIVFSNFPLCSDHTGNNGNMIIVNGVNAPPQNVWCQYIEVEEGIEYQLEAYINTLTSFFFPQAELQFYIDGDAVGNIFDPPTIPCFSGWVRMNASWVAPSSGTITFCIYNHRGNVSPVGNGFIIDDIAMYPICEMEDELSVEIREPVEVFLEEKICWNEEPFEINGQFFSEAGSYTVTIERSNQCDSIIYLDLEVITLELFVDNPGLINCNEPSIFLDASFSTQGDFISFEWSTSNGNILNGLGTPQIEVDAAGNYFLELIYDDGETQCSTGEISLVVDEDRNAPEVVIFGEDELNCSAEEIELEAEVTPAGTYDYQWSTLDGNIVGNDFQPTVTVDAAGFYQLIVSNIFNGCSDTAFFEVGLSADFPVANAGGDRLWNCNDSLLVLDGSQSEQGSEIVYGWTTTDGLIQGPSDEINLLVLSPGTYILEVANRDNGCSSLDSVRVRLPEDLPLLIPEGDSLINCNRPNGIIGFSLRPDSLEAIFNWTTIGGNIISTVDSSFIEITSSGWYIAEVFFPENGCTIVDSIQIAEDFNFPIANAGRDTVLGCNPPSIILDGSNSDTSANLIIEWTGPSGGISSGANSFFPAIVQAGTYFLNITNNINGCTGVDSVIVVPSDDLPQISFDGSRVINCIDTAVIIQAIISPNNFVPVFDWMSSDGNFEILADSSSIVVYSGGTYSLSVIFEENQCSSSDLLVIEEDTNSPIIQFLSMDSLYCGNEEIRLEVAVDSSLVFNYSWTGPSGGIVSGDDLPFPQIGAEGWYVVTVINESNGCNASDSTLVNARFDIPVFEIEQEGSLDCSDSPIGLQMVNSNGLAYLIEWSTVNGSIITDPSEQEISIDQAGWYFLTVTHPFSNCVSSDSIEIINSAEFPLADAGPNMMLNCRDSLITLDGSLSDQGLQVAYLWETPNGNIISGENQVEVLVDAPGVYYLIVTNTDNSCSAVDSVVVSEDRELPIFTIAGDSLISCSMPIANLELVFQQDGNYSAEWLNDSGELITSGEVFDYSTAESGLYSVILMNLNNFCDSFQSFNLLEDFREPLARIECLDCGDCISFPVILDGNFSETASGEIDFNWEKSDGVWEDIGSGRILVRAEGWYVLEVEDTFNGCYSKDSIFLEKDQISLSSYNLFPPDCLRAKGEIHFDQEADIVAYSIDGGQNWQSSAFFSDLAAGLYDLMVRSVNTCESEVFVVELTDERVPIELFLPFEIELESGSSIQLNLQVLGPDPGPLSYSWEPTILFDCSNCPDPLVGPITEDQLISVQVLSVGGCVGSAESWMRLKKDTFGIYIPNAFSPNDDGINDRLVVFASDGVDEILSISIFSRWGELFFTRENFPPNDETYGWDGTLNGEKAMPGIYVVMVEVEDFDGSIKNLTKSVTLIR